MRKIHAFAVLLLGFLLISCTFSVAQTVPDSVLTNAGVTKMVKSGLPEGVILRVIGMSRTNFDTSPAGLIDLRKRGASEAVLNAVLDSWNAGGMPAPAAMADGAMAANTRRPAQLPSFQADLKVNKKTHERISMGHNHIEVQGTGVPSVSVQWQTDPPNR